MMGFAQSDVIKSSLAEHCIRGIKFKDSLRLHKSIVQSNAGGGGSVLRQKSHTRIATRPKIV
jgi:hypothetical protein